MSHATRTSLHVCHGFTTKVLISMHIRACGSAPFFAQTVITLTDNGFITEPRHEKPCLSGSRPGPTQTELSVQPNNMARGLTLKK